MIFAFQKEARGALAGDLFLPLGLRWSSHRLDVRSPGLEEMSMTEAKLFKVYYLNII